jgi:hypothetical protein
MHVFSYRSSSSAFSTRAKAILDLVAAENNCTTSIPTTSKEKTKIEINPIVKESIDKLYARPYSMISQVFDKFCDTQTTFGSHHLQGLEICVIKLKATLCLPNTACESLPSQSMITTTLEHNKDLTCYEKMPSISGEQKLGEFNTLNSPSANNNNEYIIDNFMPQAPFSDTQSAPDFDSDDSVRDKDYIPSNSSDDSDCDLSTASFSQKTVTKSNLQASTSTIHTPLQDAAMQPIYSSRPSEKTVTKKRRNTIDLCKVKCIGLENVSGRRRNTIDAIQQSGNTNFTSGTSRKRKLYTTSLAIRMNKKKQSKMMEYIVKSGCNEKCSKKCTTYITEEQRKSINKEYWSLTWEQRRLYIRQRIATAVPKRKYTKEPIRNPRKSFTLKTGNGNVFEVCKVFFLTTLGFKKNNDKVLRLINDTDHRGKHV